MYVGRQAGILNNCGHATPFPKKINKKITFSWIKIVIKGENSGQALENFNIKKSMCMEINLNLKSKDVNPYF